MTERVSQETPRRRPSSPTLSDAARAMKRAEDELREGESLLRFAVECERAVYEGRVNLPPDLLRRLSEGTGDGHD